MSKTLDQLAQQLKECDSKVQLIYAFNGTGKTRLSQAFKKLVSRTGKGEEGGAELTSSGLSRIRILYYSAFTEDLFYWDNDLTHGVELKLKIQPNTFTDWVFMDQGQDQRVIETFQRYTNKKLTPRFNEERQHAGTSEVTARAFSEVSFSMARGDDQDSGSLKISKGEESSFIWSVFFTILDQVIDVLNVPDPDERETNDFDDLRYVFVDDPVSSLDENHLIQLAVDLADLIRGSTSKDVRFIVTTHNTLFYNVLYNELKKPKCFMLNSLEDGGFSLDEMKGDSNRAFSYHLHLRQVLEEAVERQQVRRYHFTMLRNLYEKTASFLGYDRWGDLLPDDRKLYLNRIIQFSSHSTLSDETVADLAPEEQQIVRFLLIHLLDNYGYWKREAPND